MATFSITVPDDKVELIANAFAYQFQPTPPVDDAGNPLTGQALIDWRIEFARQQCMVFINGVVRNYAVWEQAQQIAPLPDVLVSLE